MAPHERLMFAGQPRRVWTAGLLAGVVGVVASFAGRGIVPGRLWGDPLPLALGAGSLLRGLLHFNWRAPLGHALFAVALGVATAVMWRAIGARDGNELVAAARIAAMLNLLAVAALEIDAVVVALWYVIAALMSGYVTVYAARAAHRLGGLSRSAPR